MTDVTLSPARTWRATVPPHPSSSSSGWAAMTRTRLGSVIVSPGRSHPALVAQLPSLQHATVLAFDLEQSNRTVAAPHRRPAGLRHGPDDRPDDLSRRSI